MVKLLTISLSQARKMVLMMLFVDSLQLCPRHFMCIVFFFESILWDFFSSVCITLIFLLFSLVFLTMLQISIKCLMICIWEWNIKLPGDCSLEWQEASITVGLCSRVPVPTPATLVKPRRFVSTGEELSILLLHMPPCAQGWAGLVAWGQEQLFSELGRACTWFGAVPGLSWNS